MTSFAPPSATTTLAADVVWRALRATQAAAVAAAWWAGRGDAEAADAAATAAMRSVLAEPGPRGIVVTGEGAKDGAPMLADGEQLGDGTGAAYAAVATALGKRPNEVRAVVLDKPRHTELVARLRAPAVRWPPPPLVTWPGALMVLDAERRGRRPPRCGRAREGVLAACAGRALGGFMHGRRRPRVTTNGSPSRPSARTSTRCSISTRSSPPTRRSSPPA